MVIPAVSPTERSESVSGMSAGKPGQVFISQASAEGGAAQRGPEGFLPQVLLRGQLKTESQLKRREK